MNNITNFFPITLAFEEFQISRLPYTSGLLAQLRNQYNATHSFFRTSDFIYLSPMSGDLEIGEVTRLTVKDNVPVVSSLIKHIFFRTFRRAYPDIIPLDFYPFRILSRHKKDDLVSEVLPEELKEILSFQKLIDIQFREIQVNGQIQFGALVNVRYRWIFNRNCQELVNEAYDVQGLQVITSEPIPGLEGILAPDESLIGTIIAVEDGKAVIETSAGQETHKLQELFLHKSTRNIREYLEFKIGKDTTKLIFEHIRVKDRTRLNAKYYLKEINLVIGTVAKLEYLNRDGFCFSIAAQGCPVGARFNIQAPSFIFDYNPGATHLNQSGGLINYGPYDSSTFDIKHPSILVVCHKSNRGGFASFLGKLKDGIPSSRTFKGGMIGKYRLHNISFEFLELENYDVAEYQAKLAQYIRAHDQFPHLAIVETVEWFRNKPPYENPYYQARAYLLNLGIPVQFIKNEKIRTTDDALQWICESVALQIYAKLGGIPWVLPASSSIDHEIIVGIGSTLLRPNLLSGNLQERIVGITTFFTGDGRYILGNKCREVLFEEYFDVLLDSLRQSIGEISCEYGWQADANIRITFHIFKPMKNIEADVVEQLLRDFTQYNIQYCFVTVSERHPFLIFDATQGGRGYNQKGEYVPERGINWKLDELSCLLQLKGPQDIKTTQHKFSNPILIRIHDKSTYRDLNTVVQQIFNFTYLSWRGFNPAQQPVTILYSDLIAKQLAHLRKIETWRPEIVNSLLKAKKWFL